MSGNPVFFSAQKTDGSGDISGVLTFNQVEGSGFDGATGKFHAPEAGTYGFHFSGLTGNESSEFRLHVFKDGRKHHDIYDGNRQNGYNNVIAPKLSNRKYYGISIPNRILVVSRLAISYGYHLFMIRMK